MSKHPTGRGSDQFVVRFPDGMRDKLKRLAAESGRSLNAEIVHRLQDTLDEDDMFDEDSEGPMFLRLPDDLAEKISAAAKRMNRTTGAQALDTLEKAYMPPKG